MIRYDLSDTEKRILRALASKPYNHGDGTFSDLSRDELCVASGRLKSYGFIIAHFADGGILGFAKIDDEGRVYLKENQTLENPVDDNELKRLQIDKLEYEKRIRKLEGIIRLRKVIEAIIWIALFIFGVIGWLLYFIKIR